MVDQIHFLVEERSMEVTPRSLLPKIVGRTHFEIYTHRCKADLMKKLPDRMRGYARWLPDRYRVVVLVDRDDESCVELKAKLEEIASDAKLVTRKTAGGQKYQVVNRVVIEELEAWFFGDWEAVRRAYPKATPNLPQQSRYRDPDGIAGGTCEALHRVLQRAGYFKTSLRKTEAARCIAEHMNPAQNRSRSFQVFREALVEMTQ